jgi:hypothetical protein
VAGGGTIGAGNMALMDETRLFGDTDTAKPLAAIADDGCSGLDTTA